MNSAPFDIHLVIRRIKDSVPDLREVAGRANYAAIKALSDFPTPSAYVLMASEDFEVSPGTGSQQEATVLFGVAVAVRNYRSEGGCQAKDELNQILGQIRDCLKGWEPEDRADPIQLLKGNLVDYDAGNTLWVDVYQLTLFNGV